MSHSYPRLRTPVLARGFTLIEILIALVIGLFLMGALLTIVQANRRAFGDQSQLAQLQDSERMAMTMMTDVIQSAGYFPKPWTYTLSGTMTVDTTTPFGVGESVSGVYSAAAPGDQISVRYMTLSGDNILNCSGQQNSSGANVLYVNTFQVTTNNQLVCNLTSNGGAPTTYTLVNGVRQLSILYGVKANAAADGNNVDSYMTAEQVTANALWGRVISVLVKLTFTNPMYVKSLPTKAPINEPTVTLQRVIGVMNQAGPMQ